MYIKHLYQLLNRHKIAFYFAVLLAAGLCLLGVHYDAVIKPLVYMATLVFCFLVSEFIYFSGSIKLPSWQIKNSSVELKVILMVQVIVVLLLIYWFVLADPQSMVPPVRISLMIIRLIFAFPVFLLVYFLAIKKYPLREIGFRFRYWYIAIPMIILIGGVSYLGFSDGIQFQDVFKEYGYHAFITLGFLTAALPEEITRYLFQSRLSFGLNSKSLGWIIASIVWAAIHIPSFGRDGDYVSAATNALGILPLGLLWGYLNERYKSIIPSVLIHGTNLWGLQNIF